MNTNLRTEKLDTIASMLRLAGDATRLRILCVLFRRRSACVSEVAEEVGMSVAAVSHHLSLCAKAGLLVRTKRGKTACYAMSEGKMAADVKDFICKYK